ncbi:hypothetical protein RJ55_00468 [Drechmeria coniospora]|nr:hypothetical protein RJ55_00468 [Drechmeria coniospora]
MDDQRPNVEILVHVAAPSRSVDDIAYRQLALAYLAFQPETAVKLPEAQVADPLIEDGEGMHCVGRRLCAPSSGQEFATALQEHAFGPDSQDLSFQSAWDNCSSPPLQPANLGSSSGTNVPTSPGADTTLPELLPSQISDSYPLPDSGVLKITPTRILQRYLRNSRTFVNTSPSPRQLAQADNAEPELAEVPSSLPIPTPDPDIEVSDAKQIVFDTPAAPTLKARIRKRKELAEVEDASAFDMTHVSNSPTSTPAISSYREGSDPLPLSRSCATATDRIGSAHFPRSSSVIGPARASQASDNSDLETFADGMEIVPPSPPVGVTAVQPSDLISNELAKLAHDLSSRFRPVERRPVEPLERGYWLLDTSHWTTAKRAGLWRFLTNYIHSGLAGWGVWCRRDRAHDRVRLYCWGCVAKHTYLLLYLASERQVKTTGASWFGAEGDAALEVPPSGERAHT